jgi:hypothetical protein
MRRVRAGAAIVVVVASFLSTVSTAAGELTTTVTVHPRERCGGFNGHVRYGPLVPRHQPAVLKIWGKVWDTCRRNAGSSATSVWLSYNDCGFFWCAHNKPVGAAYAGRISGVNDTERPFLNPGHITVTVCSNYARRWRCGPPVHV